MTDTIWIRERQLADARERQTRAMAAFDEALRQLRLADAAVQRAERAMPTIGPDRLRAR